MPITVTCPTCNARLGAPDNTAGKRVKCPKCGAVIPVPPADDGFEVVEDDGFEVVDEPPARRRSAEVERPRKERFRDEDDEDDDCPRRRDEDDDYDDRPAKRKKKKRKAELGPVDGVFRDTSTVALVAFALCCSTCSLPLSILCLLTYRDEKAKSNASLVLTIIGVCVAINLVLAIILRLLGVDTK